MNAHTSISPRSAIAASVSPHPQLLKLEALRAACDRGLLAASKGELFACVDGIRLINAAHDLTECDELYRFAGDVCFELGLTRDDAGTVECEA